MSNNNEITVFAKTNFRNREVPFGIKTDDRRRHMYIIGKTGMGKTTLMENMAIQDIRNGHGVAFLDPHGDSVQRILNCVPSNRINDVVYFNPADLEYPVAFNILEAVDQKYKHLVASGLMGVFTKIWANLWSARMEYILNNTILALLDSPGNTLLGITRMYVDKKYRKRIVDNIKDPMVKAFWTDEFANYNEKYRTEAIAPIQNKVGQFLSSAIIRNIVGQPKSTIDLRDIMDNRKVLIMDLSKGRVGEDNSALLGAMIVTKLQLAAMSRTDIPEHERKDFYLYVDEFQNFATESFATILSEARKYRLNLIIGHQYIAQLEQDHNTKVRDAIFGNVGTIVVFRIGAADAEFMETEFEPLFTPNDMVNLPKHNIILKLMINGVASDPFTASTLPPNESWVSGNYEKIIKVSRERYSNPREEVEDKISRWMGAEYHQESAVMIGKEESGSEEGIQTGKETAINAPQDVRQIIQATETEIGPKEEEKKQKQPNVDTQYQRQPEKQPESQPQPHDKIDKNHQQKIHEHQEHRDRSENHTYDHRQHVHRRNHKPNYQQAKKENPIWETVAGIRQEKSQEELKKIHDVVRKILMPQQKKGEGSSDQREQETKHGTQHNQQPPQSNNGQRTTIKPGESHKF